MIIIGIDPGFGKCGVALVEDGKKPKLIFADCIETDKGQTPGERLQEIKEALDHIIKKYRPDEAAVEELFFAKNAKTAMGVGQARGVILLALAEAGVKAFPYKPAEIKLTVAGVGNADKKQVQKMVKLHLKDNDSIVQDDTADGVAVALCHLMRKHAAT